MLRRFERFKAEAMQGFYEGKSLSPNDGVLALLMKHLLESVMDGGQENYLNEEKASGKNNQRNGEKKKTVRGINTGTFREGSSIIMCHIYFIFNNLICLI